MFRRREYKRKRNQRRQEVLNKITDLQERLNGHNHKDNKNITERKLHEIRENIRKKQLKASVVLKAFQARTLELHGKTKCLVEPVTEAETDAEAVDAGKTGGLLAGIPVSIKDDIAIKGYVSTTGASKWLGKVTEDDSVLVKVLKKHGAVIYARTNEPQLGLSAESGNPIYGKVINPHGSERNPGGSSSGEGALIGGGGSLLGFGSDIGGSIRIPAHNCGCCGFKPTSERISHRGMSVLRLEESAVPVTWGPLARDVDSLVLAMRALWDGSMTEFDPLSPPLKFQDSLYDSLKPLKIGYFYDNGFFAPTPVCRRAVDMAVKELEEQGHMVVEWNPPDAQDVDVLESRIIMADGGKEILSVLQGDEVDDTLHTLVMGLRTPGCLRWLVPQLAKMFISEKDGKVAETLNGCKNVSEYWMLEKKLKEYQYKVIDAWMKEGLDAVLSPPLPYPALPLGNPDLSIRGAGYMMFYNVLNFPAGVVRMTKQNATDIQDLEQYDIRDKFHEEVKRLISDGEGLPAGVMVASLRWQDEKCLRVMKAVEKAADFVIT